MRKIAALLIVLVLVPSLAHAAIALVGTPAEKEDYSGTTSATCAHPAKAHTTGNLIVVGLRSITGIGTPTVADTAGNTYTLIDSDVSSSLAAFTWYAKNITGHATNVITITTGSGNFQFYGCEALEYSGLDTSSPLDATAVAKGVAVTATTVSTAAFTTAQAAEVVVCHLTESGGGGTFTAGTGYTLQSVDSLNASGSEDQIFASIQTGVTASVTHSSTTNLKILCAPFKGSGGGASVPRGTLLGVGP